MAGKDHPRIAMLAAEAAPFAKVGGLGDVLGSLPKALDRLGAAVAVIIPFYKNLLADSPHADCCRVGNGFDIPMGAAVEHAEVWQSRLPGTRVEVYRIGSSKYFDRAGIYDDPVTREGYPDNMERFIFFMKSAIEWVRRLGVPLDILHCHDSHTALVPGLMHPAYRNSSALAGAGTLFTIHNLAYQGLGPKELLDWAGIAPHHFHPGSPFEYWGQVNFMKAGIELADKVNTVSPTYAEEIRTDPEFGWGLEGVLQYRKDDLSGIVNGIDYEEWNPETDPHLPAHFSMQDLAGKALCKAQVRHRFGLPPSAGIPLVGIVSRLADQKGFDLIAEAMEEMAALPMQLVILGTGQQKYHDLLRQLATQYPGQLAIRLEFDNALAHQIEAGCDMFLMPSRYEPCGLNQLYSFRYGTIPIVRKTGGLADTVIPASADGGTGFCFTDYAAASMLASVREAIDFFSDTEQWRRLMLRAMAQDWSWDNSARQYLRLYQSIYSKKHRP